MGHAMRCARGGSGGLLGAFGLFDGIFRLRLGLHHLGEREKATTRSVEHPKSEKGKGPWPAHEREGRRTRASRLLSSQNSLKGHLVILSCLFFTPKTMFSFFFRRVAPFWNPRANGRHVKRSPEDPQTKCRTILHACRHLQNSIKLHRFKP